MAAALRVSAREADGGAFASCDGEVVGVGGGVGFEALDAGAYGDGFAGVGGGGVVGEGDGFEVVGPEGEGEGAGGFAVVAGLC